MAGLRRLPLELFPPFKRSAADLVEDAFAAAETFKGFLLGGNWDLLHAHSASLAGLADLLLRRIQTLTDLEDAWAKSLSDKDSAYKSAFAELGADTSAEADDIRAAMLAELEELSGDAEEAQTILDQLLAGEGPVFSSRGSVKSAVSSEQDMLVSSQVRLATLANRAAVEACIFKAHELVTAMEVGPAGEADTQILENEAASLRLLHDKTVQSLFTTLGSDADREQFVALCVAHQGEIAARLPTSALLVGGYLALLAHNDDAASRVEQSRTALTVSEWIRRLSIVHAFASLARAEAATVDPGRWYSNERRRVKTRFEKSQVPSGQATTIAAVRDGELDDGSFVAVEGRVENLVIRDDPSPPKFSSFFDLVDVLSGDSVVARAHMFSLINNGLSNGAYVRLSGFLRTLPSWSDDAGIDIDRVSLTELRKESWYDDVTHRVRAYAQLYLDEMNMFFTPALDGA